jgi:hypothetical protein
MPFNIYVPTPDTGTHTYELSVHVESYALDAASLDLIDGANGEGIEVSSTGYTFSSNLVLEQAATLTGSVTLPPLPGGDPDGKINYWECIDVQAISTSNSAIRYWGWGQIDGNSTPTNTGNFTIDGIADGTYDLEVRVWGYATNTDKTGHVVDKSDNATLTVGNINISSGRQITGTLTIRGDTSKLQTYMGDDASQSLSVWIDAWSPTTGAWGGTQVTVDRGTDQQANGPYIIGGLSSDNDTYELHSWLADNYELTDSSGNAPVLVSVDQDTETQNIELRPYQGVVQGNITGPGTLDIDQVVILIRRPWDWMPPKYVTVNCTDADNQIVNNGDGTGTYKISGLGTDDYIVKAAMFTDDLSSYTGPSQPLNTDNLTLSSQLGAVQHRVFVENSSTATTKDIAFETGYSVSGTITLDPNDPPWHDGTQITIVGHIVSEKVKAKLMDMVFMGEGTEGGIAGTITEIDASTASYSIVGLAPGVYLVKPPFGRSEWKDSYDSADHFFDGGEQQHHWAVTPQTVVVTDSNVTGVNFTLSNGNTISGTLTLPEAPSGTDWEWIGHIELETPASRHMGHGKPLFKNDFGTGAKHDFSFEHVADGDYLVRFWTDRYVPGTAKVTVSVTDMTVNLTIENGANIEGMLVDAATGQGVTSADGIRVVCEAVPWVEGSWRETREDPWAQSYIEVDKKNKDPNDTRTHNTPGKFHLKSLPSGHKYVLFVEATHGQKTGGAKNYVGYTMFGIDIPEGATSTIDVGTIQLTEGTTIKGRITDGTDPISGVEVHAFPSDTHDGMAEAEGKSDADGYYTVYGIDPNIDYYDLVAAERPFLFEDWGKTIQWGEERKYNVAPETTDANFTLTLASGKLSGTITIPNDGRENTDPDKLRFMLPFKGCGEEFPVSYILLQKNGVIYKDMLEGIEGMTSPTDAGVYSADYSIDNVVPGKYKITFMNYGLPTLVFDGVQIGSDTDYDLDWRDYSSTLYKVSGSVVLSTGGYPSSSDISGVVCMDTVNNSIVFGLLTEEADGTYSAYEVPGLEDGRTYQVAFFKESGMDETPDIYPAGASFTANTDKDDDDGSADGVITNNATITRNTKPVLMIQAVQDGTISGRYNVRIFSTSYLVDESVSEGTPTLESTTGLISVKSGFGDGNLGNVALSADKRTITATYDKAIDDSTVKLVLAVHYGDDATILTYAETLPVLEFDVAAGTICANANVVNTYTAGQVKLGNGDPSQIFVPSGAFSTTDGRVKVEIKKLDEETVAAQGAYLASLHRAARRGSSARAVTALPADTATAAGDRYEISAEDPTDPGTNIQPAAGGKITVQLKYDPSLVSDTSNLYVYHLPEGSSTWVKETGNLTIDTENKTISVEVTNLSPFLAGVAAAGGVSGSGALGSSDLSSSCFMKSAEFSFELPVESAARRVGIMLALVLTAAFVASRVTGRKRN